MFVARRGAHLAAERSPSAARADGARRSVAVELLFFYAG